jgi:hypothetical protein
VDKLMMKESVVIGDQVATKGTIVMVKVSGRTGMIQLIGRCGLVSISGPASRPFAPSELEVIRKEESDTDDS